ncbi:MAG TPA: pilus assembly protein [Dermatophilaceae bacterium]|nr:pilus assembly protein [Dermatophilaceae bacterium]
MSSHATSIHVKPASGLRRRVLSVRRREDGRAIVEFILIGVTLLVPLVYLVTALAAIQGAAFAATSAAREAGRAYTTATTDDAAGPRARAAAAIAFGDFGLTEGSSLTIRCDGAPCLRSEGRVTVTATVQVRLPLVPDVVASVVPAVVPVSATHVAGVDRFGGR